MVGSQIVVLGNDNGKDILELRTNNLKLFEGTTLSLHDALYAPEVRNFPCIFCS